MLFCIGLLLSGRLPLCLAALALLLPPVTFPQQGPSPQDSSVRLVLRSAYLQSIRAQNDSALILYKRGRELARQAGLWTRYTYASNGIADIELRKNHLRQAFALLEDVRSRSRKGTVIGTSELARTFELLGFYYLKRDQGARSVTPLEEGLNVLRRGSKQDSMRMGNFLAMLGEAYKMQGKYDAALTSLRTALTLHRRWSPPGALEPVQTTLMLASIQSVRGEHDSAAALARTALQGLQLSTPFAAPLLALGHATLAIAEAYKGNHEQALEEHRRGLEASIAGYGPEHPTTAECYFGLGERYMEVGDYERAKEHFDHALTILRRRPGESPSATSTVLIGLAHLYFRVADFQTAWSLAREATTLRRRSLGSSHPTLAHYYELQARSLQKLHRPLEAVRYCRKALDLRLRFGTRENRFDIVSLRILQGTLLTEAGTLRDASNALQKASLLHASSSTTSRLQRVRLHGSLGRLDAARGRFDEALQHYQQALMLASAPAGPGDPGAETSDNSMPGASARRLLFPDEAVALHRARAALFRARAGRGPDRAGDLLAALDAASAAIELSEQERTEFSQEGTRILHSQSDAVLYDEAIDIALLASKHAPQQDSLTRIALGISDRARARTLFERTQDFRAADGMPATDTLLAKLSDLDKRITSNAVFIARAASGRSNEVVMLEAERLLLRSRRDTILEQLSRQGKGYQAMNAGDRPESSSAGLQARQLQETLDPRTAVIEYHTGETTARAFVVTHSGCEVVGLGPTRRLAAGVSELLRALQAVDKNAFARAASSLYDGLIRPFHARLEGVQRLVIIQDGILHSLPFEVFLKTGESRRLRGDVGWTGLPYLMRSFSVEYAYSCASFLKRRHESGRSRRGAALVFAGFAPGFTDSTTRGSRAGGLVSVRRDAFRSVSLDLMKFDALRYSTEEVQVIAEAFRDSGKQAEAIVGSRATEGEFKSRSLEASIVHVATHGVANEAEPSLSALIFAGGRDGSAEDGILYAGEVNQLRLNADLLVLSACQSGLGKLVRGEGMIALPRAFHLAGVRNVIYTLWPVGDQHAARIMLEFYKALLKGSTYPESLRQAKLRMLLDPATAFPGKWAGFTLLGR